MEAEGEVRLDREVGGRLLKEGQADGVDVLRFEGAVFAFRKREGSYS